MKKAIVVLAAAGLARAANAQFYGGDFDGQNALSSEKNTAVTESWVFDNFTWPGGPVHSVIGHFLQTIGGQVAGGEFEIRANMAVGDGGVVVMAGSTVSRWTPYGPGGFGMPEWTLTMDAGNLQLAAGNYWIGVRPIGFGTGRAFVTTTDGVGGFGGPLNDDNSFFDSSFFGVTYGSASDQVGIGEADFSYGIVVPAPGVLSLAGLGGLLAARRRRRAW